MSSYEWRRFHTAMTFGATGVSADLMLTLHPGECLERLILDFDYGIFDTTNEYTDLGTFCASGVTFGTSAVSSPATPIIDWASTSPRWYRLDQMIFEVVNAQVVAGTTSYIARNNEHSRHVDTRQKLTNRLSVDQFMWFTTAVPSQVYTTGSLFGSASAQCLILVP